MHIFKVIFVILAVNIANLFAINRCSSYWSTVKQNWRILSANLITSIYLICLIFHRDYTYTTIILLLTLLVLSYINKSF